jgi:dTDP-4-amino-4,6-dideoxygalactose transaminase
MHLGKLKIKKMIRLSKSCLSDSEKKAVMNVLDREYLGMGSDVQKFEEVLGEFFGRPVACVSTGTAALHLALHAVGIGTGDEVLVQSLTYVASFQAISATGAIPVACDIDVKTLCLDWKDAEKKLTPRTKAIMPVHYAGGVGELSDIYAFAEKHNLRVIEDAAHAFGTIYKGERIGGFGDVACFSFDGIKNITSGEGGCVVTDDKKVLQRIKDARLLGVERDTEKRYSSERSWEFDVTMQGWRYHMSNIMAAIGIEQLIRFPELSEKRKILASAYKMILSNINGIGLIELDYNHVIPHIFAIILPKHINRDALKNMIERKGIQTGIHYQPNHWLSKYKVPGLNLKYTDEIYLQLLTLPLHPDMGLDDVSFICNSLKECLNEI